MGHHPNLSVQLDPAELDALRELAKRLGLTTTGGTRTGEGSPRQLLMALATAAQRSQKQTAATLRSIIEAQAKTQ